MDFAEDHPDFNGVQIQKKFSWSKRYVNRILKCLIDSKLLDRTGSTSETRYRIRFDTDNTL
jgi:hypothetical protein